MPYIVRDLGKFTVQNSSGGANFSSAIGGLDDASNISVLFTSSAGSSATILQVSLYDPYESQNWASTAWFNLSTNVASITSSGSHVAISNIAFRGLRLSLTATSSVAGEVMAYVLKQVTV